jgi:hypothetical protein
MHSSLQFFLNGSQPGSHPISARLPLSRRRHSALDYRSPAQFEQHWLCSQRKGCSGGGSKGGETCLIEQVGSRRLLKNLVVSCKCMHLRGVTQYTPHC